LILLNAYNDPKAARWLSERVHAPAVVLPYSVGGTPGAKDLVGLFDDTIAKLLGAMT
jgi:zinc/manganese transport system substrate-binding protein